MASARVSGENQFLSQVERVRVELRERIARAHQALQERKIALLSELQQLEQWFSNWGPRSFWDREAISDGPRGECQIKHGGFSCNYAISNHICL